MEIASELTQFRENLNCSYVTSSTPKYLVEINGHYLAGTINSYAALANMLKIMCKPTAMTEKDISIQQFAYK
jgi:hypothetical protein